MCYAISRHNKYGIPSRRNGAFQGWQESPEWCDPLAFYQWSLIAWKTEVVDHLRNRLLKGDLSEKLGDISVRIVASALRIFMMDDHLHGSKSIAQYGARCW